MGLTRQEAADALVASGLDTLSLEAVLDAFTVVLQTGFGEVAIRFNHGKVTTCDCKVVIKPGDKSDGKW